MKVVLECTGCAKQIILPGFRYRSRIKQNPNREFYCSYRCAFPIHTDDPTKKHCAKCNWIKRFTYEEYKQFDKRIKKIPTQDKALEKMVIK